MLAVIVLYKMKPSESVTLNTLQTAISRLQHGQAAIKILLYDNTPGGQDIGALPADVQYKADVQNGGVAKAYNYALEIACEEGCDWLLTLDQDTSLPTDFLCKLCPAVAFVAPLNTVGAIVPWVSDDGRVISPFTIMKYWIRMKPFLNRFIGIPLKKVYALNSASTIRVSTLTAIGGYNLDYYLDYSDIEMYHRLQSNNFSVFVAGNVHVDHESSINDLTNRSTPIRYEGRVRAEEAFFDEYLGRIERIVLLLKMFYRSVYRIWRMGGSLPFFKISLLCFCRRLFSSRKHRMESRKQSAKRRLAV
jgi:GT2 family glycosyltransferase